MGGDAFAGATKDVRETVGAGAPLDDIALTSSPLKLRLLYRFAESNDVSRSSCMSSALLALPCTGLVGVCRSIAFKDGILLGSIAPAVGVLTEGSC